MLHACRRLVDKGLVIYATAGTFKYLQENGIPALRALWPSEVESGAFEGESIPAAVDLISEHKVDLVINIPKKFSTGELTNGYKMRRAAIDYNIPLITNSRLATAFIAAFSKVDPDGLEIKAWDEY